MFLFRHALFFVYVLFYLCFVMGAFLHVCSLMADTQDWRMCFHNYLNYIMIIFLSCQPQRMTVPLLLKNIFSLNFRSSAEGTVIRKGSYSVRVHSTLSNCVRRSMCSLEFSLLLLLGMVSIWLSRLCSSFNQLPAKKYIFALLVTFSLTSGHSLAMM